MYNVVCIIYFYLSNAWFIWSIRRGFETTQALPRPTEGIIIIIQFLRPGVVEGNLRTGYSHQQHVPDKFSALVALAKMPSAFPSGNQFSHGEQFIYDSKFSQLSHYDNSMVQTEPLIIVRMYLEPL
jgi:hypothetical protein